MIALSSAGIGGIGSRSSCIAPSGAASHDVVERRRTPDPCRDSRRGSARRGSPCARAPQRAIASDTVSRCRRSSAVCQPGLYSRLPGTPTVRRAPLQRLELAERLLHLVLRRARCRRGPASSSCSDVLDLVRPSRRSRRARTARARSASPSSTSRVVHASPSPFVRANFAAYSPARLPNTSRSDSELPPSRFAPCSPAAHSPHANRPGTVDICVSPSTRMPPIM